MNTITFRAGDKRQAQAGVPGRRLDDRASWPQFPFELRRFDHGQGDAILD